MFKSGTLVKIKVNNEYQLGWVIRKCSKDGGTIVFITDERIPYHEICVKENDFIESVKSANIPREPSSEP